MTDHDEPDLALLRGMLHPRMSRRGFLRTAGVGAAGLSLSGLLAACGGTGEPSPSASAAATGATGADRRLRLGVPRDHGLVHVRELAALHRPREGQRRAGQPVARALHARDRHRRALRRGDPGLRRVLREAPHPARGGATHRLRPDRHGLPQVAPADDGERLPDPARPLPAPELRGERRPEVQGPHRTTPRTGSRSRTCRGSRGSATTRSSRGERSPACWTCSTPRSRGRWACSATPRTCRTSRCWGWAWSRASRPRPTGRRRRTSSRSNATTASCASTSGRTTSTRSRRATSRSRWRGRPTCCSSR